MKAAVIINPISGLGGSDAGVARARAAADLFAASGVRADVFVTERPGHARELGRAALDRGATLVFAWGGDGTINEVGSALAWGPAALAIVPVGSGNGLARELGIRVDPARAIATALGGRERVIDAGELDGRLFFNVAGAGLDARVALRFGARARGARGLLPYVALALEELCSSRPEPYLIAADGESLEADALLIAFANSRQYGNGAVIAPDARLDDGRLDLVVVERRSWPVMLANIGRLRRGGLAGAPGVRMRKIERAVITARAAMLCHVDGEPFLAGTSVTVRVCPAALRVRVP